MLKLSDSAIEGANESTASAVAAQLGGYLSVANMTADHVA